LRAFRAFLLLVLAFELSTSCTPPDYRFEPKREGDCHDKARNGDETDRDCGGSECPKCEVGKLCSIQRDCVNGSCAAGFCQARHCTDELWNEGESDFNCGGPDCAKCGVRQHCERPTDCITNACIEGECIAAGCDDEERNGDETAVDCGGGTCPACRVGEACELSGHCTTGICYHRLCTIESCTNHQFDAGEERVDCGGDCSIVCNPETCRDGKMGELETSEDCGGNCLGCAPGEACDYDHDCLSNRCVNRVCIEACTDTSAPGCTPSDGGAGGAPSGAGGAPEPMGGVPGETGGSDPGTGGTDAGSGGTLGDGGDGSGDGGTPATGGTGTGGAPATGGTGTGGTGTGGTTGGTATGGMPPGPLTRCTGCAKLEVPLATSDDKANFVIFLPGQTNFSNAVLRFRVYKEAGIGGEFKGYIQHQDTDFAQLFGPAQPLASLSGWQEFVWNVAEDTSSFNKTTVQRVGVQVIGWNSTAWSNPTIVYVDSIVAEGAGVGPWNFDSSGSIRTSPTTNADAGVLFINSGDSPVANTRLSWLGLFGP
jgi:hypothetical protein